MPRRARLVLPDIPLHLIQRGNNRQTCFHTEDDFQFYLHWLHQHASNNGCQVHAYALMTNHVHLLVSANAKSSTADMMKALGQRYAQYVNRKYRRSGTLWEGRFRSCLVHSEGYLLACYRYIELNPVRAGMVARPADYRWSSYRANAHGESNPLLNPHVTYDALGTDASSRQEAYRQMFQVQLEPVLVDQIRRATNGNFALGDPLFVAQIEAVLGCRAAEGRPGRPRGRAAQD
jgi:putative transposase